MKVDHVQLRLHLLLLAIACCWINSFFFCVSRFFVHIPFDPFNPKLGFSWVKNCSFEQGLDAWLLGYLRTQEELDCSSVQTWTNGSPQLASGEVLKVSMADSGMNNKLQGKVTKTITKKLLKPILNLLWRALVLRID